MTQLSAVTESNEQLTVEVATGACGPHPTDIESRAYGRYLERGCLDGFDVEDWLAAEAELRNASESGEFIRNGV